MESGKITLRSARELNGYTMKDIASQLGISARTLGRYERDSGKTPCSIIVKLCRLYKMRTTNMIYIGLETEAQKSPIQA